MFAVFAASCKPISDVAIRPATTADAAEDDGVSEENGEPADANLMQNEPADNGDDMFSGLYGEPASSAPGTISAPYGALYNISGNAFIYGKGVDERVYPSGAVKLLTALTVCDTVRPDFVFTVGGEIDMIKKGSGVAGLKEGQRIGMEAALTALLIPVGNDAAYTVAVGAARADSGNDNGLDKELLDYFIRLMNDYAKKIGCLESNFTNPDGYHAADNYTTVRDLTILSAAAASNAIISGICARPEPEAVYESGEIASWTNSNALLNLEGWDIRGLKTGYTDESGYSAQILAYIDGSGYIAVVSGCETAEERERDIIKLLKLAIDGYGEDVIDVY